MPFFRTVFRYEVLSAGPSITMGMEDSLLDLHEETHTGMCSGVFLEPEMCEVDANLMARLLMKQGSDPEFLLAGVDYEDPFPSVAFRTERVVFLWGDETWSEEDMDIPAGILDRQEVQDYLDRIRVPSTNHRAFLERIMLIGPARTTGSEAP
jgi:hypothetical protein